MQLKLWRDKDIDSKFCNYKNILSTDNYTLDRIRSNIISLLEKTILFDLNRLTVRVGFSPKSIIRPESYT